MTTPTVQELAAVRADLTAARAAAYRLISRVLADFPRGTQIGDAVRTLPEPERTAARELLAVVDGPDYQHP